MESPSESRRLKSAALSSIVGRDQELSALKAALATALAGRGGFWVLAGAPGIGKSRLAQEIVLFAQAQRAVVATGYCTEDEGSPPYLPFVEALGAVLPESATERADLGEHAPFINKLLPRQKVSPPVAGAVRSISPETERYLLFEAVTAFLRNLAQESGLVLLVEDLHSADQPSLLLLQHLARRLDDTRILVIGTFRDLEVEADHPLSVVLGNLRRDDACQRLGLRGLTEEQVRDIVEATAQPGAPAGLIRALHRQAEGNPFFIKEMVIHLMQLDVSYRSGTGWVTGFDLDEMGLPESVKDAIGRRLTRLSDGCRSLLRVAAVVGEDFRHSLLAELNDGGADELLNLVEEALAARLLIELPGREAAYAFGHALIRQTLLEELSRARRQRLHRQIAQAIERLYRATLQAHMSELAYHYFEAATLGQPEKAAEYAKGAAEAAGAALGYEEAARLYEMALQALDLGGTSNESLRCELLLALGEAEMSSGRVEPAREVFGKAAGCARALRSPVDLARAAIGSGGPWIYGGDAVVQLLEEAADVVKGVDEVAEGHGAHPPRLGARSAGSRL